MKNKLLLFIIAALCVALMFVSCGNDPVVENPYPDTPSADEIGADEPAIATEPPSDFDDETPALAEDEFPVVADTYWSMLISELTDVGLREYGDMAEIYEMSYGKLCYDNTDMQGSYKGGYMHFAISGERIGYMELELPADYTATNVCNVVLSAFDRDYYEYYSDLIDFIENNIDEGGEIVLGNAEFKIFPGINKYKPITFIMEAEGDYIYIVSHE